MGVICGLILSDYRDIVNLPQACPNPKGRPPKYKYGSYPLGLVRVKGISELLYNIPLVTSFYSALVAELKSKPPLDNIFKHSRPIATPVVERFR